jgi:hypothetical protein
VEQLYERVKGAIERYRGALEALAEALLEKETLEGAEALAILQAGGVSLEESPRRRAVDPLTRASWRPSLRH